MKKPWGLQILGVLLLLGSFGPCVESGPKDNYVGSIVGTLLLCTGLVSFIAAEIVNHLNRLASKEPD